MKNISIAFNGVLAIAVGILFYLHFSKSSCCKDTSPASIAIPKDAKVATIVYVNSDSLLNHYEMYGKMKKQLEAKYKNSETEINNKMRQLQSEVQAYQQKAASLTPELRAMNEESLGRKQQELMQHRDELSQQLVGDQQKMTEQIYASIFNYLKEFNQNNQYQFVLGYQKGGGILYASESLDITKQIQEGLNKEYNENNKK
jgi:outer membrane protein